MQERIQHVGNLQELVEFVHRTLCEKENLLGDQFSLQHTQLLARGRSCGLQFSLHGPRSIRLGAVWAADQNIVFFYDTRGERYLKVKLSNRLLLERETAFPAPA